MSNSKASDLAHVDLLSDDFRADPSWYFSELLEKAPVLWNETHKAWLVSSYDDVVAAFKNECIGSDRVGPYVASKIPVEDLPRFQRMFDILARWMVFLAPPDHTRLRNLVHRSFTPRRIKALEQSTKFLAERMADALRDRLRNGETIDLMAEYCNPLPGIVIAGLFGVPPEDGDKLKNWAEELGLFINGVVGNTERNERVANAMLEFEAYLLELIEEYRKSPDDNILSGLVSAADEEDKLSSEELIATCMLILDAGYKTVQNTMGNALLTLIRHPKEWAHLTLHPEDIPKTVEECLRYCPPGGFIIRRATEDTEIGGCTIAQGSRIYLAFGAANRDPSHFPDPNTFSISRANKLHLTFGQGIHFCLGASLARLELAAALEALLARLPAPLLAVAEDELEWQRTLVIRGLKRLPVRLREGDS